MKKKILKLLYIKYCNKIWWSPVYLGDTRTHTQRERERERERASERARESIPFN